MTALGGVPVLDVDVHLDESANDLRPYCDQPWRRVLAEPGGQHPPWSIRTTTYPRLGPAPAPAPAARTPAELVERLGQRGVDAALLLPGASLRLGAVYKADYAAALARAYNRWLAETWLAGEAGLLGAVLAVPHAPEEAARQIEELGRQERVAAVVVPTAVVDPLWGDRRYDPIYAAAAAAGLPVILHGAAGLMVPGSQHLPTPFASDFEAEPLGQSLIAMATLNSIVGTGVPARFPGLQLIFLGAGITWLMHMLLRLDKEYLENRRDVPWFADRISAYLRRQVWVGTQPMEGGGAPGAMDRLVRLSIGIERVLYGSHWPHADHDSPARVAACLADDEARHRVLGANARTLFGLRGPP